MVLKIGEQKWHLHFRTTRPSGPWDRGTCKQKGKECACHDEAITEPYRCRRCGCRPLLWNITITCLVHTGICIMTHLEPKYCVNGRAGVTHCSLKDQFVRSVGHKLALAEALKGMPESTREQIWYAYWQLVRRPKETSRQFKARTQGHSQQAA